MVKAEAGEFTRSSAVSSVVGPVLSMMNDILFPGGARGTLRDSTTGCSMPRGNSFERGHWGSLG